MGLLEDAIERLKVAVEEVVSAAVKDDKTPLMNQPALRQFGERLVQGFGLEPETETETGVIDGVVAYGDINNFKAFNTKHGHEQADLALHAVGVELKVVADLCNGLGFRRSGDEFVLLIPAASLDVATSEIGSRMKRVDVELGPMHDFVTLSFGYANTAANLTLIEVLQRAERASDVAKLIGPGSMIPWEEAMDASASRSYRSRCDTCGTVMSLTIPGNATMVPSYPCPVCSGSA